VETIAVASEPRGVALTLIFAAMPSRGKRSVRSQMPLVLSGTAMVLALKHGLFEALDGAHIRLRSSRRHGHAQGYSGKIHVRSGRDPVRSDQLTKALPGEDHHVGRNAAASWAAIVCGPTPCDEPDRVVTLIRRVCSNSGKSCSYAPANPPDIKTVTAPIW
jgi:hypothetical protein